MASKSSFAQVAQLPGKLMGEAEPRTVLQDHGVPTRLIDSSSGPLEALFFAVDRHDSVDG